jgi:hypothetical protein
MKTPAKRVINPTFTVVFIFLTGERSALLLIRSHWVPKPFKKRDFFAVLSGVVARADDRLLANKKENQADFNRNWGRIWKQGKTISSK